MQEVQALCDRVIIINAGKIVADNKVSQLKNTNTSEVQIMLELEEPTDISAIRDIEGVKEIEAKSDKVFVVSADSGNDIRGDIFRKAVENGWVIIGLNQEEASLEHIFQNLTIKN